MWRFFMVWLLVSGGVGYAVYTLKYEVQRLERRLNEVNRQILSDEEAMHVLKAEWSFLNRPDRVDDAARRILALEPLKPQQFGTVAGLPMRGDAGQQTAPGLAPQPLPGGGGLPGAQATTPQVTTPGLPNGGSVGGIQNLPVLPQPNDLIEEGPARILDEDEDAPPLPQVQGPNSVAPGLTGQPLHMVRNGAGLAVPPAQKPAQKPAPPQNVQTQGVRAP